MILWIRDRFRNLSLYHYAVIVVTIFVPLILGLVVAYPAVESLAVRVIVYAVSFLIWALFVVIVVALLVERDAAFVNRLVSRRTDLLAEQFKEVKEEHGGLLEDMRLQMEDLERRTRLAFEAAGGSLPPRTINLRSRIVVKDEISFATLRSSGGGRWGRFRQRLRRVMVKVWKVVYGDPERR